MGNDDRPAPELRSLEPGDGVWFDGYGNGVVERVNKFGLWIRWERAGLLDHEPSFARWLTPSKPTA